MEITDEISISLFVQLYDVSLHLRRKGEKRLRSR